MSQRAGRIEQAWSKGCILALSLVCRPKLIPVVITPGFIQSAEVAQSRFGPELAAAFETTLLLTTSRFNRSRPNGPAALGEFLVVHPAGIGLKIVLFALNHFSRFAAPFLELEDLAQDPVFLSVSELMPQGFHPLRKPGLLLAV